MKSKLLTYVEELPESAYHEEMAIANYIYEVENGRLFGLPLTLESVIIHSQACFSGHALMLPPATTKLEVLGYLSPAPYYLEILPPNLSELKSTFPSCESTNFTDDPSSTALYNLPQLKSLRIERADDASILLCVPRNLQILHSRNHHPITHYILESLPQSLTELTLETHLISDAPWIHLLPHSLRSLDIMHTLHGDEFGQIPPNLTSFTVYFGNVKLADFWTLPRSLKQFYDQHDAIGPPGSDWAFLWRKYCSICSMIKKFTYFHVQNELADDAEQSSPESNLYYDHFDYQDDDDCGEDEQYDDWVPRRHIEPEISEDSYVDSDANSERAGWYEW